MKAAIISLVIGIVLLLFFLFGSYIQTYKSGINIQVHDTYFIISYFSFTVLITLFLGTFFSLGGAVGTAFKNKPLIYLLLICVLLDAFYITRYLELIN